MFSIFLISIFVASLLLFLVPLFISLFASFLPSLPFFIVILNIIKELKFHILVRSFTYMYICTESYKQDCAAAMHTITNASWASSPWCGRLGVGLKTARFVHLFKPGQVHSWESQVGVDILRIPKASFSHIIKKGI